MTDHISKAERDQIRALLDKGVPASQAQTVALLDEVERLSATNIDDQQEWVHLACGQKMLELRDRADAASLAFDEVVAAWMKQEAELERLRALSAENALGMSRAIAEHVEARKVAEARCAAVLDEIEGMEEQAAVDEGHGGECNTCAARALREHAGFLRAALVKP